VRNQYRHGVLPLPNQLGGKAVRITEVNIPDSDLFERLTDMRVWLDNHRFKPSNFTYFFLDPGMKIRVTFTVAEEAEAFAQEFRGTLLDTASATDRLVTV